MAIPIYAGWEHALQSGAQVFGQDDASICATDRRPEHGTDGARSRGVEVRECASVEMNDRRDASSPCDGEERDVADERGELLRYWDVYRRYVTAETLAGRGEDMPGGGCSRPGSPRSYPARSASRRASLGTSRSGFCAPTYAAVSLRHPPPSGATVSTVSCADCRL